MSLSATRARGAHAIPFDDAGHVAGMTRAVKLAALVIDMNHPDCLAVSTSRPEGGVPIVACGFILPDATVRGRLRALPIELVISPDADTLGGALVRAIARARSSAFRT